MWPFNKKTSPTTEDESQFASVLCIPGSWNDWDDFKLSIMVASNLKLMAVGEVLMDVARQRHYTIDFCEHDDKMAQAFAYAGRASGVSQEFLAGVEKHKYVVYISGVTGNFEEAEHIAVTASAILRAGGIGIKVETAGKAFENSTWFQYLENFDLANLYRMFVVDSIVNESGEVFSCGMQNLGLKDTIVQGEEFQNAVDLIHLFGIYQIVDKPVIKNNQTFNDGQGGPLYRIMDEPNQPYKGDEIFGNPFGMWRLERVSPLNNAVFYK